MNQMLHKGPGGGYIEHIKASHQLGRGAEEIHSSRPISLEWRITSSCHETQTPKSRLQPGPRLRYVAVKWIQSRADPWLLHSIEVWSFILHTHYANSSSQLEQTELSSWGEHFGHRVRRKAQQTTPRSMFLLWIHSIHLTNSPTYRRDSHFRGFKEHCDSCWSQIADNPPNTFSGARSSTSQDTDADKENTDTSKAQRLLPLPPPFSSRAWSADDCSRIYKLTIPLSTKPTSEGRYWSGLS